MNQSEPNKNRKVLVGAKVDPLIRDAVEHLANTQDRTVSNVIERILKSSAEVKRGMKHLVETA